MVMSCSYKTNKHSNMTWHYCKRKEDRKEVKFIITAFVLLFSGFCFDCLVRNDIIKISMDEYRDYMLAILGIQATVSTLTIALVALISNNICETYMGIAVSDYYLNIRPYIFKQKIIIFSSIILIPLSCTFYIVKWYGLVFGIFWTTIFLVYLSVIEIYLLFRGLQKAQEEIELYVSEVVMQPISNKKRYDKIKNILSPFIKNWSNICNSQTQNEYDRYKTIFMTAFDFLIEFDAQKSTPILEGYCEKHISALIQDEGVKIKGCGIEMLVDVYEHLRKITTSDEFNGEISDSFNLFDKLAQKLYDALKSMSLPSIETTFNWSYLMDIVVRTAFCIAFEDEKIRFLSDLRAVLSFSAAMGSVAKFEEQYNKEPIDDIVAYWGKNVRRPYLDSAYDIPECRKKDYLNFRCQNYFYYCKGFIDNEYMDLIKENVFYREIPNSSYSIGRTEIMYYLSIDCYLYYLSEKESTECIDIDLKNAAKQLLADEQIVGLNDFLFSKIERSVLEYTDLEKDLQKMLEKCEWFSKYDNCKTLIMEDVVREFYVFMQILMDNRYRFRDENKFNLSEKPFVYVNQFLEGHKVQTKENLKRFYELFQNNSKNIDNDIDEMYLKLEKYIKSAYKEVEIKEAKDEQEKYNALFGGKNVINNVCENVIKHLKDITGGLNVQDSKENIKWTAQLSLLNCNLFTQMINDDELDSIYTDIRGSLVANVINELLKRKLLKKVSRKEFENDDEYLSFLRKENIRTLMGSEYIFKNSDYRNADKFKSFCNECQCIFYGFFQSGGIALKGNSIKVSIKDVKISVRPVPLSDDYMPDENGIVSYNITNDIIIPFHKDEFMVYINNKRKLLSISIEVEFITRKNNIGLYIDRNN